MVHSFNRSATNKTAWFNVDFAIAEVGKTDSPNSRLNKYDVLENFAAEFYY